MLESRFLPAALALLIFVVALLAVEMGYRLGLKTTRGEAPNPTHLGAVQGAILGLMGLLLGFSFAGASSRFVERQDVIVREANAIGTTYLRADLLEEPYRSTLKMWLREYTDTRIELFKTRSNAETKRVSDKSTGIQKSMWASAAQGVLKAPQFTMAVLPPVNEVIDLHSVRLASNRRHLPGLVFGSLALCSTLALATVGFSGGLSKRRNSGLTVPLAFLVAAVLWVTIDLDYPRRGLVRVSDQPMEDARASMSAE